MSAFRDGSDHVYISAYKHGGGSVGKKVADKLAPLNVSAVPPLHSGILCVISIGLSYIFMGEVDDDGRGKIAPHHFVMAFKAKNQRAFNMLKNKRC